MDRLTTGMKSIPLDMTARQNNALVYVTPVLNQFATPRARNRRRIERAMTATDRAETKQIAIVEAMEVRVDQRRKLRLRGLVACLEIFLENGSRHFGRRFVC